jgi:HPt (histidine-containing phosphotransfer) domain-containing protein
MPHIERAPLRDAKPLPDPSYEEVRYSFLARLQSEQIRLAYLTEAIAAAGENTVAAFSELERFAHRLRGAAAVFDVPRLREASKGLELVAGEAARRRAPNNDPAVKDAVLALTAELAHLNGGAPSPAVPVTLIASS